MKSIIALLLLAVVAQSAFLNENQIEATNEADIILEKLNIEVNWDVLLACLKEAHPVLSDLVNLYNIIKAKDLDEAIKIVKKLLDDGNILIKSCKGAIKRKSVSLELNPEGLLTCLLSISSKVPEIKRIISLIQSGKFFDVLIAVYSLTGEAKTIINQCKRYL